MRKIFIAEDEEEIIALLRLYLEKENYQVEFATDGTTALQMLRDNAYDLAILDIMMPGMNGFEVTREIRKTKNIPIIILSAKQADEAKILGLDLGADDYVTKPFNPLEVVSRVNANLRRVQYGMVSAPSDSGKVLRSGQLELDCQTMQLRKNGNMIPLTAMEFRILQLLMSAPGRVYPKSQIYEIINGEYFESDEKTIAVYIYNLREKIEDTPEKPHYIKTVRGLGYKFEKEQSQIV